MSARWIIAGGGTGGHLYPGLAIAEALREADPQAQVLFVGTERGIEARVVPAQGYALETIKVQGIKNRGLAALAKAALQVPLSILASMALIRRFRPSAVLGVGGYASGPVLIAAWLLGVPTAIQEQNALPGVTNRILGRFVRRVFTSWPGTSGFAAPRILECGNPIRAAIRARGGDTEERFTVLVFGGSQGARTINHAMAAAAPLLADMKDRLRIVHQTGRDPDVDAAAVYRAAGIEADVRPYFDDMPAQYAGASLAICRAGATSLAELAAAELPAILIPFPFAADNHQEKNADVFVHAGAARKLRNADTTGETLAAAIRELSGDSVALEKMRDGMRSLARPGAARNVVDRLLALSGDRHV